MFTLEERDRVRLHVIQLARRDARIVTAALVGSLAGDGGDQWSDVDLTFAVAEDAPITEILDEWTADLAERFEALHLIDLPVDPILYRVFLLPKCLQLDVSMTPASEFRAMSERFKLLFGEADQTVKSSAPPNDFLGWALLYARHARVNIERDRLWEAEYYATGFRNYAMSLACAYRDLPSLYGKGLENLSRDVLDLFEPALVRSLDRDELSRALEVGISALLKDLRRNGSLDPKLELRINELVAT
ncbi:MAG: nucleotidyltransferase domain-containing protein [Actinomycetota bacterium]|nr:nucleotidyltransferase domain-containing protein [Actinomycetota bacterium]